MKNIVKNKYVSIIVSLLIVLNYSSVFGSAVAVDDFESYTNGEALGDSDFPTDPWQNFGATINDPLTANTGSAQAGSLGASIVLDWSNGTFGGALYEFSSFPSLLGNVDLGVRSVEDLTGTTIRAQVIESDGDLFAIPTNVEISSANTYESFNFDFYNNILVNDGGTGNGVINLTAIEKVQFIFLNSSSSGVETFHIDNFAANVPEPSTYAAILGALSLIAVTIIKKRK